VEGKQREETTQVYSTLAHPILRSVFCTLFQGDIMATDPHIRHVEAMIGYTFKATHYLTQALTAAAVDENNYDGNRGMAQLGESLIGTAIIDNAVTAGATRGDCWSKE
jgi:hypothetical protein